MIGIQRKMLSAENGILIQQREYWHILHITHFLKLFYVGGFFPSYTFTKHTPTHTNVHTCTHTRTHARTPRWLLWRNSSVMRLNTLTSYFSALSSSPPLRKFCIFTKANNINWFLIPSQVIHNVTQLILSRSLLFSLSLRHTHTHTHALKRNALTTHPKFVKNVKHAGHLRSLIHIWHSAYSQCSAKLAW